MHFNKGAVVFGNSFTRYQSDNDDQQQLPNDNKLINQSKHEASTLKKGNAIPSN